jgi:hypothetical protein
LIHIEGAVFGDEQYLFAAEPAQGGGIGLPKPQLRGAPIANSLTLI